jgi:hypothetical protein
MEKAESFISQDSPVVNIMEKAESFISQEKIQMG